jgi:class 3 adenylate cyclase
MRSPNFSRALVALVLVVGVAEDLALLLRPRAGLLDYYHDELIENPRYLAEAGALAWVPVLLGMATELMLAALAVVILVRAWRRREARALAVFLAIGGLGLPSGLGIPAGVIERFDALTLVVGTAALVHFAMVFPEPVPADAAGYPRPRLWRLLQPRPLTAITGALCLLVLVLGSGGPLLAVGVLIWGAVAGARILRGSYRRADPAQQRRVLWVLNAFVALSWLLLLALPFGIVIYTTAEVLSSPRANALGDIAFQTLLAVGLLALPAFLAFGLFYNGALDPRLTIRRTSVYGAMGVLTLTLFMAVEGTASMQVMSVLNLPNGVGPAVAGGSVALAFGPLRRWVERRTGAIVERLIPATALAEAEREDAAIVFADICGYTRISATAEATALTLASLFHTTARRVAEQRGGRLVKTLGDGVVLEFAAVSPAVSAALEVRRRFAAAAEAMGFERPELRCGVHFGPVARGRDGDVFGAVVNLASRLEGAADPGEVMVSGAVADALGEASPWRLEDAGERVLKNVPAPVLVYRVVAPEAITGPS